MSARTAHPGRTATQGQDPALRWRTLPIAATLAVALLALLAGWAAWTSWLELPWTRDGRVRVYVVTVAPQISGNIVEVRVRDNQYVHKGDVLMVIDPVDYALSVSTNAANLKQAEADLVNKHNQATRREVLTTLSTSVEEKQSFAATAAIASAAVDHARSALAQSNVNLQRTQIRSTVNGWITNLLAQVGDYATVGQRSLSIVNADSFWIDAYFEETALAGIHDGDPVRVSIIGYAADVRGHVDSVARGIQVTNATPDGSGLASVNPIFTWVRLAQRIPVRVQLDTVPPGVRLVAGATATVRVETGGGQGRNAGPGWRWNG